MRAADLALLGSNQYDAYPRISIDGYDLESRLGFNPIVSCTWTASVDQLATSAQIILFRQFQTLISPFWRTSQIVQYRPHAGKHVALETATVAKGAPASGYQTVFDGRIDGADGAAGPGETQLTCRDMMGSLLNRIIEPDPPPESPDGKNGFLVPSTPLISHLNSIRNTVYPAGGGSFIESELATRPIVGLGDPNWTVVETWVQFGANLAEQLNQAVLQRGWAFHYRYTPLNSGAFVFYDPGRTDTGANYTVQPEEVIRVLKCTINDQDVTNVWDLIWGRGAARTRTRLEDAASIAQFGRRYGSWPEDQAGQIATVVEANRMLEGMIADTKDPVVELDYERLYFWPVELADKHFMIANLITTDLALDLAVIGYTHSIGPKAMRTVIRTRGTAIAARRRWRRGEFRMVHVGLEDTVGVAPEGALSLTVEDLTPPI